MGPALENISETQRFTKKTTICGSRARCARAARAFFSFFNFQNLELFHKKRDWCVLDVLHFSKNSRILGLLWAQNPRTFPRCGPGLYLGQARRKGRSGARRFSNRPLTAPGVGLCRPAGQVLRTAKNESFQGRQ